MNVNGIATGSVQMTTMSGASRVGGAGSQDRMDAATGAVASLLGMSTQDLQTALANGQSMSTVAASKGVSQSSLLDTISQGIEQSGAAPSSSAQLAQVAARIANHTGPTHRHHPTSAATSATDPTSSPSSSATPAPPGDGSGFSFLA